MLNVFKFLIILFMGVISCACVNTVAVHELNNLANKYLQDGNIEAAIARLEASIDLDNNIYESRYNLASAYMSMGKCDKALEHITVALELNKKEPVVYYTHGVAAQCVANSIIDLQKDGRILTQNDQSRYIELLKIANNSFDKYVSLAPGAEDVQSVLDIIRNNEVQIGQNGIIN